MWRDSPGSSTLLLAGGWLYVSVQTDPSSKVWRVWIAGRKGQEEHKDRETAKAAAVKVAKNFVDEALRDLAIAQEELDGLAQ